MKSAVRARLVFGLTIVAFMAAAQGCAIKSFTKPRSEIIAEAESLGQPIPSVEEERAIFLSSEATHQKRLLALVGERSSGAIRDSSYRLGANDEIEIAVFDVPEMNVTTRIRSSGMVSLPLVGAIQAVGLTEGEFVDALTKRLQAYVRNPQVNVFVSAYGSQLVAIMGAVKKPGTYPLRKGSNSLVEIIGEAGGLSEHAANVLNFIPAEVTGLSAANDVEARAKFALANAQTKNSSAAIELYLDQVMGTYGGIPIEIPIRGGDMIVVPEAGKVMVEGEVEKPGSYELAQQGTLLGALASAGGIGYSAKVDEIEVVRETGQEKKARLIIDLTRVAMGEEKDVRLRNGDIVRVPSDSGKRFSEDTYKTITSVINFGVGGSVNVLP